MTATRKASRARHPGGDGWIIFAGIIIGMLGILNVIYGIAAISTSSFFVQDARYIISDLRTWGWITLIIGLAQLGAGWSIWAGGSYGRWFGIGVAAVNAIGALLAIPAYPLWALAAVGLDMLVIYALAVYGGESRLNL